MKFRGFIAEPVVIMTIIFLAATLCRIIGWL